MRQPVIIIGMHRSGTSMIARLLEAAGLFSGWKKEENHEAIFFHKANDWILNQCSATWDNPMTARFLEGSPALPVVIGYLRDTLSSPKAIEYLGMGNFLQHRSVVNIPFPWGWKDPRSTFTLPVWSAIFPEVRIIHVMRHGVDVAQSLRVRHLKVLQEGLSLYPRRRALYRILGKRGRFADSVRCLSLEGGFSLWEEYLAEATKHVAAAADRGFELRYEDFISSPLASLKGLVSFCGLVPESGVLEHAVKGIRSDRTYAYRDNPALVRFAASVGGRLSSHGY